MGGRDRRMLAAILAADVVGYSRMMEADEAGTLKRLKDARKTVVEPKVAEYGGRVVKTTGDGIFVVFTSAVDTGRPGAYCAAVLRLACWRRAR